MVSTLSGLNFNLYRDKLENTKDRHMENTSSHVIMFKAISSCLSGSDECWKFILQEISDSKCNHRQWSSSAELLCITYLWANPRDMALISRKGSPVMRPSIWPLMHLISSATAGLWTQLISIFSWKTQLIRGLTAVETKLLGNVTYFDNATQFGITDGQLLMSLLSNNLFQDLL